MFALQGARHEVVHRNAAQANDAIANLLIAGLRHQWPSKVCGSAGHRQTAEFSTSKHSGFSPPIRSRIVDGSLQSEPAMPKFLLRFAFFLVMSFSLVSAVRADSPLSEDAKGRIDL